MVFDNLQVRTLRVAQSIIVTGYKNPRAMGSGVRSAFALLLPEPYVHLSAHTALHLSVAHGHGDLMITRCDGGPVLAPLDIRVGFRISPTELRFRA